MINSRTRWGAKCRNKASYVFYQKTVWLLAALLVVGIAVVAWSLARQQWELVERTAIQHAEVYSSALREFRTLYTSEVVRPARAAGLMITHDFENHENAIPLPATLSLKLAERLGGDGSGSRFSLYGPYPFPWRKTEGGLQDEFARDAWRFFQEKPGEAFYRFESVNGKRTLRYATADRMQPDDVSFHNSHPETPKNDWRVGDVRGIIEVDTPIAHAQALAQAGVFRLLGILVPIFILAALTLWLVIARMRRWSGELETKVTERTAELRESESQNRTLNENLRARMREFEAIFENSPLGIVVCSPDGRFHRWNRGFRGLLGYDDEELRELSIEELACPQDRDSTRLFLQELATGNRESACLEKRYIKKDNREICARTVFATIRKPDGRLEKIFGLVEEITEQQKTSQLIKAALEASPTGIVAVDSDGLIVLANKEALRLFGYSRGEIIGQPMEILVAEDVRQHHATIRTSFMRDPHPRRMGAARELLARRKDGSEFPAEIGLGTATTHEGTIVLAAILDVSERIKLRREGEDLRLLLMQAKKMESIGQLAAGIAHEINTPTQYVSDNTFFLKRAFIGMTKALEKARSFVEGLEPDDSNEKSIEEIKQEFKKLKIDYLLEQVPPAIDQSLEGLGRVAHIVRAMKDFSHPSRGKMQAIDLGEAIETTLTVARNEWKYVAEARTDFDDALPKVLCLRDEFCQVILNLVVNAAHAISEVTDGGSDGKGLITVETRLSGKWAEIRVSDTGTGIPEELRERVFEPFFTTKEVGKGTGQGLAIVRSVVVDKHGGTIEVESEVGKGATFVVRLPIEGAARKDEEKAA